MQYRICVADDGYIEFSTETAWEKNAKELYFAFKRDYPDCNVTVFGRFDITKEFDKNLSRGRK